MTDFQFKLQPYAGRGSRYPCPACEKPHQFTRYLDAQTGESVGERVGSCNRIAHCGYHYTPKQYFADNPGQSSGNAYATPVWQKPLPPKRRVDTLPWQVVEQSLGHYATNAFMQGLMGLLTEEVALSLARRYYIGTTQDGSTVFWQVDERCNVRTGKILHYDADTLKRLKTWPDGRERTPQWAHTKLRGTGYQLQQCLYGQHLLAQENTLPVAIVEAEKTAILCAVYLPAYLWLATGGCGAPQFKQPDVLAALQGREVLLFPDTGATDKWEAYAQELRKAGLRVQVSRDLEAPDLARPPNWDLADEFLSFAQPVTLTTETVRWALTEENGYPVFWDYPSA